MEEHQRNDPNAWALLGMLVTNNIDVATEYLRKLGCTGSALEYGTSQNMVVSFVDGRGGTALVKTYRGTLAEIYAARARSVTIEPAVELGLALCNALINL